jgi:hypothetical protein
VAPLARLRLLVLTRLVLGALAVAAEVKLLANPNPDKALTGCLGHERLAG